ncbi:hypothetical protein BMS3Abin04_00291 [bacterium BMS3Abin04]|nr:hypothetical protein BMS3Abin04_00291 [bacterium BMS3Abin04]
MPKKKKLNIKKQIQELLITAGIAVFSIVFWDTFLIYPIKLFVVILHEMSHALAAFLTGGSIDYITISKRLGGATYTTGGNEFIIAFSGYLGSLAFGSVLFFASYNRKACIWICTIISFLLILFITNFERGNITILASAVYAVLLYLSPRYFNNTFHTYLVRTLGLISSMYVLVDIKDDLITFSNRVTDSQILENLTNIPAILWGILWFLISAITLFLIFKLSFVKSTGKTKKS